MLNEKQRRDSQTEMEGTSNYWSAFVLGFVLEEVILSQHNFRMQFNGNRCYHLIMWLFLQNI